MQKILLCAKKLLILTGVILGSTGCGYKEDAVGRTRDVVIFTPYQELIAPNISQALSKQVFTPQPIGEFFPRYMKPEELEMRLKQHSILFAGIEGDSLLTALFPELNSRDSFMLYKVNDPWAKNQTVLVFIARDSANLVRGIGMVGNRLHTEFRIQLITRMMGVTYVKGQDRELTREVEEKYPFKLKVPHRWMLEEDFGEDNFVWIHAHNPDRAVFVYWEDAPRKDISTEAMIALRDSLTALYYQGDFLDSVFTNAGPYYFRGHRGIRIRGVWQNEKLIIGGPMIGFAFNAEGRFYMIDGMLFYPEEPRKKLFWLNQLEAVLATFEPEKE